MILLHCKVNNAMYRNIIEQHGISFLRVSPVPRLCFIQYDYPCIVIRKVKRVFEIENIEVMAWPASYADLNLIVNLWMITGRYRRKCMGGENLTWITIVIIIVMIEISFYGNNRYSLTEDPMLMPIEIYSLFAKTFFQENRNLK